MYSSISHTAGCCCVCSATPRIGIVTGIRRVSHTFEAVSKISEYPHSRIQIPGRLTRFLEGRRAVVVAVCFVGRVMPVGGLHTQTVSTGGQGDGSHDSDFPSVLRLPPFQFEQTVTPRSKPSKLQRCRFNPAACLCARIRPPTRLPHYSTTAPTPL